MLTIPPRPPGVTLRDWLLDHDISPPDVNRIEDAEDGALRVILFTDEPA